MYNRDVKNLLFGVVLLVAAALPGMTLEQLKDKVAQNFAVSENIQADFTQTRELKLVGSTLVITGFMALEKNGRLLWNVNSPLRYMCIISPVELIQWDADTGKTLTLKTEKLPWLKLLYENLSGWLGMDFAAMERDFAVEEIGEHTIKLVPKNDLTSSIFASVEIVFSPDYKNIEKFIMTERNGDVMTIAFDKVLVGEPVAEEKWLIPKK